MLEDDRRALGQQVETGAIAREALMNCGRVEAESFGRVDVTSASSFSFGSHVFSHGGPRLVAELHTERAVGLSNRSSRICSAVRVNVSEVLTGTRRTTWRKR